MGETVAVILAAGQGKRMISGCPKVLHQLAGRTLIEYVLDAVRGAGVERQVIVIGYQAERVKAALGEHYCYAYQDPPLGTADAVLRSGPLLPEEAETVLVVCGDTPLLRAETLRGLMELHRREGARATVMTSIYADPTGYGRVIRGPGNELLAIVEERDASQAELKVQEINTGTYCFERKALFTALQQVRPSNAQAEYYLPDVIRILVSAGEPVAAWQCPVEESMGINSRVGLAAASAVIRRRINERLMANGVTLVDPSFTYVDAQVTVGPDTVLMPGTMLEGKTVVGEECVIGPFTTVRSSVIGRGVTAQQAVIVESEVGDNCQIGPFAYLRPGTVLCSRVKVGDFVEIKKSRIGEGSKVPHLTYLGDAEVGKGANVGAGTITCNYDGEKKWPTYIEDGAFVGSNSNLVAPVRIGRNAYIGAGSTITEDVPEESLAVARGVQRNVSDWLSQKGRKMTKKDEERTDSR